MSEKGEQKESHKGVEKRNEHREQGTDKRKKKQ